MIARVVLALCVAVAAWLVCLLLAALLPLLAFPAAVVIGQFIGHWAFVIALLVGLWYFFAGGPVPTWWPGRRP